MNNFAFIIDNEVAVNFQLPLNPIDGSHPHIEKLIAAFSSNPTVVPTEEIIEEGYLWDGTNFTTPA
jgi:hypothetical protein